MNGLLDYKKANALMARYGIKSVGSAYLKNPEDAIEFSGGKPIVLKALTQKALHKTKSGLVMLNLSGSREIRNGFTKLTKKASRYGPYTILGQHMVKGGLEIILGGNVDKQFGKMVLLGLGGIYVEAFRDFALRLCPITRYDANSMIDQLRSHSVVAPNPRQREMLVNLLMAVSKLFSDNDIAELDLNPVILHDGTYDVVDIRILK